MSSKYPGVSHSPRKASSRRTVFCKTGFFGVDGRASVGGFGVWLARSVLMVGRSRGFPVRCAEEVRVSAGVGSGIEARPALMPIEVCMHRRKGEEWMTTLYLRRFLEEPSAAATDSSCSSLSRRMPAILWPTALAWFQPLYVRGGS